MPRKLTDAEVEREWARMIDAGAAEARRALGKMDPAERRRQLEALRRARAGWTFRIGNAGGNPRCKAGCPKRGRPCGAAPSSGGP